MDTLRTFGFTEDQFKQLIGDSSKTINSLTLSNKDDEKWNKLWNLKKKMIRTELHSEFIIQYCRKGIIPVGLQIRNEPGLFVNNEKFKESWTLIANRCSRDWMLLIIETAQAIIIIEREEIETLEKQLNESTALEDAKKILDEIKEDISGYQEYMINKKTNKLRKDTANYKNESVYPYIQKGYYDQPAPTEYNGKQFNYNRNRYFRKNVTFSDTSYNSSESDGERNLDSRNRTEEREGAQGINREHQPVFLGQQQRGQKRGFRTRGRGRQGNQQSGGTMRRPYMRTRSHKDWD